MRSEQRVRAVTKTYGPGSYRVKDEVKVLTDKEWEYFSCIEAHEAGADIDPRKWKSIKWQESEANNWFQDLLWFLRFNSEDTSRFVKNSFNTISKGG